MILKVAKSGQPVLIARAADASAGGATLRSRSEPTLYLVLHNRLIFKLNRKIKTKGLNFLKIHY